MIALGVCMATVLVVAQPAPLPTASPESVGLDSNRLKEASALLNRFVADRKIAGAVAAVARKGKVAYLEAVGVQDLESRAPMTERSLFRIYSMTKPVTAVAAMMLHEEGKFGLRDPVSKYLPEFRDVRVLAEPGGRRRPPAREITVEDLLLHTSGLSHRTSELYRTAKVRSRSITLPQFIANIVRAPLMEDPGTRYRYSEAHDGARAARRDLVGQAVRRVPEGARVQAARHDRHRFLGAARTARPADHGLRAARRAAA